MSFVTAHLCEPGGREINQDAWGARPSRSGVHGWALADGLGGHGGGEVAAQAAVEAALNALDPDVKLSSKTLRRCMDAAQAEILLRQQTSEALAAMRSTFVLLLAEPGAAIWGHVGDSRLYHLHEGRIVHQTADHSVPQALVAAGDLRPREVRHHADRNRLLRSLGEPGELRPTLEERPRLLHHDDAFLLSTDGFWEYVYETEVEADFAKANHPDMWLALMHERLHRRGGSAGDNYSAIAVFLDGS
jgi:serine/threonine protein phosphatase PrpC